MCHMINYKHWWIWMYFLYWRKFLNHLVLYGVYSWFGIVQVDCVLFAAVERRRLVLCAEHFQKWIRAEPHRSITWNYYLYLKCFCVMLYLITTMERLPFPGFIQLFTRVLVPSGCLFWQLLIYFIECRNIKIHSNCYVEKYMLDSGWLSPW
jgi:hypothetical protein